MQFDANPFPTSLSICGTFRTTWLIFIWNDEWIIIRWFIRRSSTDAQHLPRVRQESPFQSADPDGMQTKRAIFQRSVETRRAFGLQGSIARDFSDLSHAPDPSLHHHVARNPGPHAARTRRTSQFGKRPCPAGTSFTTNARWSTTIIQWRWQFFHSK